LCGGFDVSERGGLDSNSVTLADLCFLLSSFTNQDFVDKTGIAGTFDIHLDLSFADLSPVGMGSGSAGSDPPAPTATSDPVGSLMTAVCKLGLKLTPAKIPGEFLVVDHIEKPTGN
jgi:uncharacterized protein (TIGR03435 family)